MEENKLLNEIKLTQDDFTFVQSNQKIHDQKFETKPTTFVKDAIKRFAKNKSSVVAAYIIGILLLLSFFVPVFSPSDIKTNHPAEKLLTPKLFEAGTGWWDGCTEYYDIPYNGETESPEGFSKYAVVSSEVSDVTFIDQVYAYAVGGYIRLTTDKAIDASKNPEENTTFLYNYADFALNQDDNYKADITFGTDDNIENAKLTSYKVSLQYNYSGETKLVTIKDWSNDYSDLSINLSQVLVDNSISSIAKAKLRIDILPTTTSRNYILIKNIIISSDNEEVAEFLDDVSITDANKTAQVVKLNTGKFPDSYWQSNGTKFVYHAEIRKVSFVYDEYEGALGRRDLTIGGTEMQTYIDNGWCKYNFSIGPESFELLDAEKCPVIEVKSQSYDSSYDIYNLETESYYYRYLGYDKMPKYIFGTTTAGKDIFKCAFNSLKTSLLIAIITTIIRLFVGLIWGSVSGYFGGTVDLVMERICEIISGVPWIVVMTLTILLLGNSVVTFGIALCVTGWIGIAGLTRTQFYRFKGREYVLASRTLGSSDMRLIFKHILPNALGTIVTSCVLMVPSVIFTESTLAYLNLGLKGLDSFGVLLSSNQQFLKSYPALILFPSAIISLLMISFNLFGNGLRDALNPSLKGSD